jgi:selT/selW/selH-like putative selenoprotein
MFGVQPELIPSKGGCFEVVANGKLVFSKNDEKRFPESGEVLAEISKMATDA